VITATGRSRLQCPDQKGAYNYLTKPSSWSNCPSCAQGTFETPIAFRKPVPQETAQRKVRFQQHHRQRPRDESDFRVVDTIPPEQHGTIRVRPDRKKLIAKAIQLQQPPERPEAGEHQLRRDSETVLESELFGTQGAFTGAVQTRIGHSNRRWWNHLLDEIGICRWPAGETAARSPGTRVRARWWQQHSKSGFRIIAARVQLAKWCKTVRSARTLHRLNVIPIDLPPLREGVKTSRCLCSASSNTSASGPSSISKPFASVTKH